MELLYFRKNGERFFENIIIICSTDKLYLIFWDAIRSEGRKILVKVSNRMNTMEYLQILQKHDEKLHFQSLIFQQRSNPQSSTY